MISIREILIIAFLFTYFNSDSQDITPYYFKDNAIIENKFAIYTNSRFIYRDIPVFAEYALTPHLTAKIGLGLFRAKEYHYFGYYFTTEEKIITPDKASLSFYFSVKQWLDMVYKGFYIDLEYMKANIPDFHYRAYSLSVGNHFYIYDPVFCNISFGAGQMTFDKDNRIRYNPSSNAFPFAGYVKLDIGLGMVI